MNSGKLLASDLVDDLFETISERARLALIEMVEKSLAKFTMGAVNDNEKRREVELGVAEFHSQSFNPGLLKEFYLVVDDLRASGSVIDVWLMDIATTLKRHGYDMAITTKRPLPIRSSVKP